MKWDGIILTLTFFQSNTVNVPYFAHLFTTQWPRWKKKEHSIDLGRQESHIV